MCAAHVAHLESTSLLKNCHREIFFDSWDIHCGSKYHIYLNRRSYWPETGLCKDSSNMYCHNIEFI